MVAGADIVADLAILLRGAMGTSSTDPMHRRRWDRSFASSPSGTSGNTGAVAPRFLGNLAEKAPLVTGIDTGQVLVDIDDSIIEVRVRGLIALIAAVTTQTAAPV